MTHTLAPETEARLLTVAAGRGQAPEQALESILSHALAEAEWQQNERRDTIHGLRVSAEEFAAGQWVSPEELDSTLRARVP